MVRREEDKRGEIKILDIEALMPVGHLLRKIEEEVEWEKIYGMTERYYSEETGRPSVDPVVLVKLALLQHIYGIRSMRQTVRETEVNIAYRWFLHYNLDTRIPHFATVSYAFARRFPSEVFSEIFAWILESAAEKKLLEPEVIFIDSTQIKASGNKKKSRKILAVETARIYDEQLRTEINADREAHGKKSLKDDDDEPPAREKTESVTDPESGLFRKGEHKVEFAYTAHTACDKNNFIIGCEVTAGNVHDSRVFDTVYDEVTAKYEVETVTVDAGYKTPWICKKVHDDGRNISTPYKRPMSKKGFFRSYEYVYDEYYDCVLCPNNHVLSYSTTNRDGYREFKSDPNICKTCPYREQCTQSKNYQKVVLKHIWEPYIELAEDFRHSPQGSETYSMRAQTIERVFADAKEKHGMRYTFLRGLNRVRNWVRLKFAAMNLKKLAMWA